MVSDISFDGPFSTQNTHLLKKFQNENQSIMKNMCEKLGFLRNIYRYSQVKWATYR